MNTITDMTRKKWKMKLLLCGDNKEHLTAWEQDFIVSVGERFLDKNIDITFRTSKKLTEIYNSLMEKVG